MTGNRANARLAPDKLHHAIRRNGWTFTEMAHRARKHLPVGAKLSHTSVWAYATGRTSPKRLSYIEAIERALGAAPHELSGDASPSVPVAPAASETPPEQIAAVIQTAEGEAGLRIQGTVSWPVAIEILKLLQKPVSRRR